MKNIIIFSTFRASKKLKTRIHDKIGDGKTLGFISADPLTMYGKMAPYFDFKDMGFSRMIIFPVGLYFRKDRIPELLACDAIAIGGGNTFELLYMLKTWGMDKVLREYSKTGKILMGESAGGIVMCPKIRIAQFADPNYFGMKDLDSLHLVDFEVKPHWGYWKKFRKMFKDYANENKVRLYGLNEGQAIWVTDNGTKFYGGMPEVIR